MADYLQSSPGTYYDRVKNVGAVNGKETHDYNEYLKMGGPSLDSSTSNLSNPTTYNQDDLNKAIQSAVKTFQDANAPVVSSLQASIPETQAKYATTKTQLEGSKPSIQQRYDNLIASIKGQQTEDVNNQTKITSNELAKRGIVGSSTLADQTIQDAVTPLNTKYAGLTSDAVLNQSDALRGVDDAIAALTPQETADERAIQNAIAQLQSGAVTQGAQLGATTYGNQLDSIIKNLTLQQNQKLADQDAALKSAAFDLQKQQLANDTAKTNYEINRPYSTGSSNDVSSLLDQLGIKLPVVANNQSNQGTYIPGIGKSVMGYLPDGRALYSDGSSGWTYGKK